jgi:hypothetical protein
MKERNEVMEFCDDCQQPFELDTDCFLGNWERPDDEECDPFSPLTTLCGKCHAKRRDAREVGLEEIDLEERTEIMREEEGVDRDG